MSSAAGPMVQAVSQRLEIIGKIKDQPDLEDSTGSRSSRGSTGCTSFRKSTGSRRFQWRTHSHSFHLRTERKQQLKQDQAQRVDVHLVRVGVP